MSKTRKHDTDKAATQPHYGKGSGFHGKAGRSGAPKNNRNAMRHGLRAGQLPKDARYIELRLNQFRRTLEDAVVAAKKQVSLTDAGAIQTALRWERHACLAQRWLVKAGDTLKPTDRLTFSREIARASTERDKALATLKLDRDARDAAIDALYSTPAITHEETTNVPETA